MSLLGLANQTLTTPALKDCADRFKDQIPHDVYLYISEMFERNVERNDRLAAQLAEAVTAINDRGVIPILLKGTAMLASAARPHRGSRILSDLDIMVLPDQIEVTVKALRAIGYCVHFQSPPDAGTWHADLKRPSDVGMVDLQRELPGPAFFYRSLDDITRHCQLAQVGRGSGLIPSATYQALVLVIHDEFQDTGYWIGNIDLRHLIDLRNLAISPQGIDWRMLASLAPDKLARNALETELVTLSLLLGVDVPARLRTRYVPRLQHWRRMAQAGRPFLRQALLPIAVLDYRNHREGPGAWDRQATTFGDRKWRLPKRDNLRFLLAASRAQHAGKI
jgi:hypothetical protein